MQFSFLFGLSLMLESYSWKQRCKLLNFTFADGLLFQTAIRRIKTVNLFISFRKCEKEIDYK